MKKFSNNLLIILSGIGSFLLSLLPYFIPVFSSQKHEMGNIAGVGSVNNYGKAIGQNLLVMAMPWSFALLSMQIFIIGVLIVVFIHNVKKKTLRGIPSIIFVIPNAMMVIMLFVVPFFTSSSTTSGDSSAWYSESTLVSLNWLGWIMLVLTIASAVLLYIFVNKFRKVESDAIEAAGGTQIETTEVVIKGKKSRKERKDEEIEVDNGDFQL